jgi:hypothetical protein
MGNFEFTMATDQPFDSIQNYSDIYYNSINKTVLGKWSQLNAGGCSSEPTFYKNPQYEFKASKEGELMLELTSVDLYAVGIAVFESDGKLIQDCDAGVISNVYSNSTFLVEMNSLRCKVKEGMKYTIVVSTYKPQQHGYFELKISMNHEFEI